MSSSTKSNVAVLVWHLEARQADGCGWICGHPERPRAQLDVHSLLPTAGFDLSWVFGGEEQDCHQCVHERPCAGGPVQVQGWFGAPGVQSAGICRLWICGFLVWLYSSVSGEVVVVLRENCPCLFHGLGETRNVGKGWAGP